MKVILLYLKMLFYEVTSLKDTTDVEGTMETIKSGVDLKGTNVWILVCSALLASIGLDTNSSAIIIGAMLISPLMSPILGVGLGVGVSDRELTFDSAKNMGLAVFLSLLMSCLYFLVTPLGQPTAEMAARTKPTLLDVGVAVFGGVAGIVANSRKEKTNAIPGVAIATALMPPLCTAGFGLAKGNIAYFLGAIYLFFINAVFISLSTYLMVRFLKFPYIEFIDNISKRKMQRWITTFAVIVMIPSAFIFYDVVMGAQTQQRVQRLIETEFKNDSFEAIDYKIIETDTSKFLKLYCIGDAISERHADSINNMLPEYGLRGFRLRLVQMNVPRDERDHIKTEVASEVELKILNQMNAATEAQNAKQREIDSLNRVIDDLKVDPEEAAAIKEKIFAAFPEIADITFGLITQQDSDTTFYYAPIAMIEMRKTGGRRSRNFEERIEKFLELELEKEKVLTVIE